jgi:hypothetical protein
LVIPIDPSDDLEPRLAAGAAPRAPGGVPGFGGLALDFTETTEGW